MGWNTYHARNIHSLHRRYCSLRGLRSKNHVTCRCNGKTFLERIDLGDIVKQFTKFKATATEDVDIGTTVGQNLLGEIKNVIVLLRGIVPFKKLLSIVRPT